MIKHFLKILLLFMGLIALGLLVIFVVSYLGISDDKVEEVGEEVAN